MILEKIIFTFFFILLNLLIYFLVKKKLNIDWKTAVSVLFILLVFFYCYSVAIENNFFNQILIFGSLYSLALLILHYMFKIIDAVMQSRFDKLENDFIGAFLRVFNFIKNTLIFILITVFQIMLIWYPAILERMEI